MDSRPLKPSERSELIGLVSPLTYLFRWFVFALIVLFGSLLSITLNSITSNVLEITWWPMVTVVLMIFLFKKFKSWSGGKHFRQFVKEDLSVGLALELNLEASRALVFPESEDEGKTYFVEDTGGKVFYFSGQDLPKLFPCVWIAVTRAPKSKYLFGIKSSGDRITPIKAKHYFVDDMNFSKELSRETFSATDLDFERLLNSAVSDD